MLQPIKIDRPSKAGYRVQGFGIEILRPGQGRLSGDSGIGAIGRIDHALIKPGTRIRMHTHKDDEILTYIRDGQLEHLDSIGNAETVNNSRLMMMNAGAMFEHEEFVPPSSPPLKALQIFMRPRNAGLEPMVQFHQLGDIYSKDQWRLLAGRKDEAIFELRSDGWVFDSRLSAGRSLEMPQSGEPDVVRLLYVFAGRVRIAGMEISEGGSVILPPDPLTVSADIDSDLVLFATDVSKPVFKGGMFSGDVSEIDG